jgi:hypothetical protein
MQTQCESLPPGIFLGVIRTPSGDVKQQPRECVCVVTKLIGTRFSNLYTAVDTPAA